MRVLPLFPLSLPLFPGLRLDLQIFEQRYLKLVRACLREDSGFGICAIKSGSEVGSSANLYGCGTEVNIVDWNQLPNGLLGITVEAAQRFSFSEPSADTDSLLTAEIDYFAAEDDASIPEWASGLSDIYEELCLHPEVKKWLPNIERVNSSGLGWGLSQVLPMCMDDRIKSFKIVASLDRLEFLAEHIQQLSEAN